MRRGPRAVPHGRSTRSPSHARARLPAGIADATKFASKLVRKKKKNRRLKVRAFLSLKVCRPEAVDRRRCVGGVREACVLEAVDVRRRSVYEAVC